MIRIFLFFLFFSCSVNTRSDCKNSARGVVRSLVYQLKTVKSCDDLQSIFNPLKKRFNSLVDIMIMAQELDVDVSDEIECVEGVFSWVLKKEFERIFQIHGCPEKMQEIQREALIRLDKYHQRVKKGH